MPPAAYRGGENSVSVSWPGASKPRRAAGGWFSSECDKIGSSPRCSRGWHEHRRSTYNNGSHAGRASTCAMNPQAISRARRRLCGGRAKSLTLSRRPGAATLPVVTEVSPSQVYGARLLSGFGAQPHREFKSRHLRQTKRQRRPGYPRAALLFLAHLERGCAGARVSMATIERPKLTFHECVPRLFVVSNPGASERTAMTRLTSFVQTIPAMAADARMCAGACCRA